MKGDFSKDTFRKDKHFHDVRMQQGRVMLDSEWNEQADIASHRLESSIEDIIGQSGAPINNSGFKITIENQSKEQPKKTILSTNKISQNLEEQNIKGLKKNRIITGVKTDLKISKGHYYVDGILCENDIDLLFTNQADYPTHLPTAVGTYKAYLDVWKRHITAIDDESIREVALGVPDTTTRSKTVWQVKLDRVPDETLCGNSQESSDNPRYLQRKGLLLAQSQKSEETINPCGLTATGGYRRLENQLYRVEIHKSGNRNEATFKWSRDNGSIVVKWEGHDESDKYKLMVSNLRPDELLGFKAGNWVELIGDNTELFGNPGVMAKFLQVEENLIILDPAHLSFPSHDPNDGPAMTSIDRSSFGKNPKIRRWDSSEGEIRLNANLNSWIPLEDGVEVNFGGDSFKTGDYWLIPARTATADIEWPKDGNNNPIPQPPQGSEHHYADLAILKLDESGWHVIHDCRKQFKALTELTQEKTKDVYVSGSKSCCIMVGPDHDFKTINDAIESLLSPEKKVKGSLGFRTGNISENLTVPLEQGNVKSRSTPRRTVREANLETVENPEIIDACICLQPGSHSINDNIVTDKYGYRFRTLKISGSAAYIEMSDAVNIIHFKADKIVLEGLSVMAKNEKAQIILSPNKEIIVDHCDFTRPGSHLSSFIIINKPKRGFKSIKP